jgi:hypothetical protein
MKSELKRACMMSVGFFLFRWLKPTAMGKLSEPVMGKLSEPVMGKLSEPLINLISLI